MIDRLNNRLADFLYYHPFFFFMFPAGIVLIFVASCLLVVEIFDPSPSCEFTQKGVYYEFKGNGKFYSWAEIDHGTLRPSRYRRSFALKYSFDLSGPVCELKFYDVDDMKTMERIVEENGIHLEIVPLTEEDLKKIRYSYLSNEKEEYVIGLFSR